MSLINQMLKDLEKRRAKERPADHQPDISSFSFSQESRPQFFSKRKLYFYAAVALTLILLIGIVWTIIPALKKQKIETKVSRAVSHVLPAKTMPASQLPTKSMPMVVQLANPTLSKEATLSAISMAAKDHNVSVNISVSSHVHYTIVASKDHGVIVITLDNTTLGSSFQMPTSFNAIIKSIKTRVFQGDLQVIFAVQPDTKVLKLQYSQQQPITLQVGFVNPSTKAIEETQAEGKKASGMVVVPLTAAQIAEQAYQGILNLISAGRFNIAIEELKQFTVLYPDFIAAKKTLVILLIKEGNYPLASQFLDQALQLTPEAIDLIILKARLYVMQGNEKRALEILQSVSPSLEAAPDLYSLMAAIQQRLGNFLIAAHLYVQLLVLNPSNSTWWMGLGLSFEAAGRNNAAADAYKKAISTGNLSPNLQAYVATRLQKLGN